nr:class I tRNA ligase family protein [Candidatus Cloacimonadota bacterium]
EWSDDGVMGAFRFLNRVWRLIESNLAAIKRGLEFTAELEDVSEPMRGLLYSSHSTVKKWLDDCQHRMQYNTAIAAVMEHLNHCAAVKDPQNLSDDDLAVYAEACGIIPQLLYPFAPHIAEELWQMLGFTELIHESGLPGYEEKYLVRDLITYVVQINGKLRGKLEVPPDIDPEELKRQALEVDNVKRSLEGWSVKKVIIIPGKMVSIAAGK